MPPPAADAFLAVQGDRWDMFCALIGATTSLLLLSRLHDRRLARLGVPTARPDGTGARSHRAPSPS